MKLRALKQKNMKCIITISALMLFKIIRKTISEQLSAVVRGNYAEVLGAKH